MLTKSVDMLGIFSNKPEFEEVLHIGKPNIGDRNKLYARIDDLLERNWLTNNGKYVQEFESRIADYLGVKHCIAICNGTVALEIAIRASGMKGEVILPSFTFVATAHSLQWQEITPVFCDIDPVTHTIDPLLIERHITPRTTGIIGVHLWGKCCNIEAIESIASKHNLKLIFDASHSLGCSFKRNMIGGFGNAETLSFHATKFINSFEGGAVVTNDDDLAMKIRLMKNFGFKGMDNVVYIGTNGKMSEVSAAMGLTSLDHIQKFIETNRKNYYAYCKHLEAIKGIRIKKIDENERNNYQYIVIEIESAKTGISRDLLMRILQAENIRVRRYFYPACHRMEPYRSYYPNAGILLPVTEQIADRVLCLPTGSSINTDTVRKVCSILRFVIDNSAEIKKRLISDKQHGTGNRASVGIH
jgi:dTDP-4-amino-4,6-dideoxygalactose transaminase